MAFDDRQPKLAAAPSWSWGSTSGLICHLDSYHTTAWDFACFSACELKVAEEKTNDLLMRGRFLQVILVPREGVPRRLMFYNYSESGLTLGSPTAPELQGITFEPQVTTLSFCSATTSELRDDGQLRIGLIVEAIAYSQRVSYVLLLRKRMNHQGEETYERIGCGVIADPAIFGEVQERSVKIE